MDENQALDFVWITNPFVCNIHNSAHFGDTYHLLIFIIIIIIIILLLLLFLQIKDYLLFWKVKQTWNFYLWNGTRPTPT